MRVLEKLLRWTVLAGVFALPLIPLIVANWLFFPYITGKNFAFRILVELSAGAWLALALAYPRYRPRRSWLLGAFALFVAVLAIADLQGVVPFKSFWSNFERMDGWVTLAHLALYLSIVVSVLQAEGLWRRLWQWTLAVSGLLSVIGFMQVAGVASVAAGFSSSSRVDATFGNPIYLAVYMLFNIGIAALLVAQEGRRAWHWADRWLWLGALFAAFLVGLFASSVGARDLFVAVVGIGAALFALSFLPAWWLYSFVAVLDTLALLFSSTRGATLGLIGGAFLALILYAFSADASKPVRYAVAATVAAGVVLAGGLWLARDSAFVKSVGILDRLASISLNDNDTKARIINIETAWKGVQERPLLGWGQENFAIVFDKYYDPRMYAQEQWFDRVHDSLFDWWIAGGTLGLLSYLSVFAGALFALWRKGAFTSAERSILTGLLAGYFAQNLTVFDNVTSWLFFVTVLGYVAWREAQARGARPIPAKEFLPAGALGFAAAACMVVAAGAVWWVNEPAYAANLGIIAGLEPPRTAQDLEKNLASFEQAISYGSYGTQEAREQLAQLAMQVAAASSVPANLRTQFTEASVQELDKQSQLSPLDARFPLFAGGILDAAGDYAGAAKYLELAHALSPDKQTIILAMAQNAQAQGNAQGALADLKEAYELDTDNGNAFTYYLSALYAAKQYSAMIPLLEDRIRAQPSEPSGYFELAAVYYVMGDTKDAIATLRDAEQAVPAQKVQVEQVIQEMESGTFKVQ